MRRRTFQFIVFLFLFFLIAAGAEANTSTEIFFTGKVESLDTPVENAVGDTESKKADIKPAYKKIGTDLVQLIDDNQLLSGQSSEELKRQMKSLKQLRTKSAVENSVDGKIYNVDTVYVYIYLKPSAADTHVIDSYAADVTDRDEENSLAVAWVDVKNLEALASLDDVRAIRTVLPPLVNNGSVTSEGDAVHRADTVRAQYGKDGSGLKVGIISDGVDHWQDSAGTGDLPSNLTVLSNTQGGDEGTAMLEIVNDLAPGAQLYFHDCGSNTVAFNNAIDKLVAAGCKVICDDISWITEPSFEDGTVASHVASVLEQNDVVYVSSAGNEASAHYRGMYYNDGYNFHDFSGGTSQNKDLYLDIPPGGYAKIILKWDDKFGASGNDYDLYLFDKNTGQVLYESIDTQDGSGDPLEVINGLNTGSTTLQCCISVRNCLGLAAAKTIDVTIYGDNTMYTYNVTPAYSIFGQAAVPKVLAVGAINVSNSNQIATYSSQGPVTIQYPSPETRNKPDICGMDGVAVTGAGSFSNPFYGTSAAAPHVAAIAALTWSKSPGKTAADIRNNLTSTAVDLGDAGFDYVYGYGRVDALNANPAVSDGGGVTLTSLPANQAVNKYVTITATAQGIENPVYQFWVKNSRDDSWVSSGEYGTSSLTFTQSVPGTYVVVANAKSTGAPDSTTIQSDPLNVCFTKMGSVSQLVVSGPEGSQAVGSSATFTATATDEGGTPFYEFWLHDATDWRIVQNWSMTNYYVLNDLQPGSYVVAVNALDQSDKEAGLWDMAYYKSFVLNVGSSVSLTTPDGGSAGTPVTVSANAVNITNPVYQFWYKKPDGSWVGGNYDSANSYGFTPTAGGICEVIVYAKDPYAPADWTHSVWSEVKTINIGGSD